MTQNLVARIDPKKSEEMLEYQKKILMTVYDCGVGTFKIELEKSKRWLLPKDIQTLVKWVWETFSQRFNNLKDLLAQVFTDVVENISSLFVPLPSVN
ncbi:hypothetical protein KKG31_03370 [Patescibacteria group bacterium]|nr:hypothetical protein [Patescibacteria group bacterium]MBU1758187.1 hypothetical protein [Patescibacteria group bacterium]